MSIARHPAEVSRDGTALSWEAHATRIDSLALNTQSMMVLIKGASEHEIHKRLEYIEAGAARPVTREEQLAAVVSELDDLGRS